MKHIKNYINEKLHIASKSNIYAYYPETWRELREIIIERIKTKGPECDLNDIDVSEIEDMSDLFNAYDNEIFKDFNGDVSQWNVSNVKYMKQMFYCCVKFNGDISQWDVSNVKNMRWMFGACKKFNCDISGWDVSNVDDMGYAFWNCPIQPEWYK